jgi:hypothetical protein
VYDTLLFLKASEEQANLVDRDFCTYENSTVQLINPMKCTMLFGVDCPVSAQDKVKEILNMSNITERRNI